MKQRINSIDTSGHTAPLFRDVSRAVCRAYVKKHGKRADIPLLSHALSDNTGGVWVARDIASADVAIVNSRLQVSLVDEAGSFNNAA